MRSIQVASVLSLFALLCLPLGACNNTDPPRLYAEASWKMRCPSADEIAMGCAAGCSEGMDRGVANFTGEDGALISCRVTETADQRFVSFSITTPSGQRLAFQNVGFLRSGGTATSGTVRLYEDNEYVGVVGGAPPSNAQPCQITDAQFVLDEGEPTVQGHVYCRMMRAEASMTLCRGLSATGGIATSTQGASFKVAGCAGLSVPAP